jgi:hypothetical protein
MITSKHKKDYCDKLWPPQMFMAVEKKQWLFCQLFCFNFVYSRFAGNGKFISRLFTSRCQSHIIFVECEYNSLINLFKSPLRFISIFDSTLWKYSPDK